MVELCTGFIKKPYEMLRIIAEKYKNTVSTAVLEYAIELARTADTEGVVPAVAKNSTSVLQMRKIFLRECRREMRL